MHNDKLKTLNKEHVSTFTGDNGRLFLEVNSFRARKLRKSGLIPSFDTIFLSISTYTASFVFT